ncbi:MAG: hypothetical protein WDA75_11650 [Candidatus Latescibacterota bacterium]|jgi:hypothetical protein
MSAQSRSTVTPSGSAAVLIDGVPRLVRGQGQDCTFTGALAAALSVTADPYDYDDLMGLSGLAFRVRWANEDAGTWWCRSCTAGETPDQVTALKRATGWRLEVQAQPVAPSLERPRLRQQVVASLDAGLPVLTHSPAPEMAVLFGYRDAGALLVGHDYDHPQGPWQVRPNELGPVQLYLGEHGEAAPLIESLSRVLATAVTGWERERHDGGAQGRVYWYGDAAYGAWLRDLDCRARLTDEQAAACTWLHLRCYRLLADARAAAARFLQRHAGLLKPEQRERVEQAASLYRQLAATLDEESLPWAEGAGEPAPEIGQRQQGALARARVLEAAAVDELRGTLALDVAGEPPPRRVAGRDRGTPVPWTVVHREETRVWLEGIDHRQYDQPTLGAATDLLRALGYQADYTFLMGISGAAFAAGLEESTGAADLDREAAFLEAALQSAGLTAEWPAPGSRREAIARGVDAGRPLLWLGAETGCIFGHEGEGQVALCRRSGEGRTGVARVTPDAAAGRVAVPVPATAGKPAQHPLTLAALRRAIALTGGPGGSAAACAAWVSALRGYGPGQGIAAATPRLLHRLIDARRSVATYLPVAACRLRRGRKAVEQAARWYGEAWQLLAEHETALAGRSAPFEDEPGAGILLDREAREAVARLLEQIAGLEAQGLAALAQALQEEG